MNNNIYYGTIWALLMSTQDLLTYYLYPLLIISSPNKINCENFLEYYTWFALVNTVVSCAYYIFSGYLTDWFVKHRKVVFVLNILQIGLFSGLILPYSLVISGNEFILTNGWIILFIIWQTLQLVFIQINNSYWKVIKEEVESLNNGSNKLQQINDIGNIGDLVSDLVEIVVMAILCLVIIFCHNISIDFISLFFFVAISLFYLVTLLLILKLYSDNDNNRFIGHQNILMDEPAHITCGQRINSVYANKIVVHTLVHCLILLLYSAIIQYPISFDEIQTNLVISYQNSICDGEINNILVLGLILNMSYLVGSVAYRFLIVGQPAVRFYKIIYPVGIVLLVGITVTFWFNINSILTITLISIAQIIPYYLTYYDYYLFTEHSHESNYGLVLGIYGTLNSILTVSSQLLFLVEIDYVIVLVGSGIILIITVIYSYYLAHLLRNIDVVMNI